MALEILGTEVRNAYNGAKALELFERFQPEFVLLDLGMSNMNGFEVATQIRKSARSSDVTLVAITAWGTREDKLKTSEVGFDHHLTKLIDLENLRVLLDQKHWRLTNHLTWVPLGSSAVR